MTITIDLSSIGHSLFSANASTWLLIIVLFIAGVAASIIVELIKRKHSLKQQQDMANKTIAWLLTAFTTLFTFTGYAFFFIQSNSSIFSAFPFLARHVPQVLGVLWFVYQLRLNKWYKAFANKFGKKPISNSETIVLADQTEPVFPQS